MGCPIEWGIQLIDSLEALNCVHLLHSCRQWIGAVINEALSEGVVPLGMRFAFQLKPQTTSPKPAV